MASEQEATATIIGTRDGQFHGRLDDRHHKHGRNPATAPAARLAAALAFAETAAMAWQCLLFLRTDLYAVLATAIGCHNLWRVKTLSLRRALKILTPAQAVELSTAGRRDLAVARWFRWLWLAGFLAAAAWFAWFSLPTAGTPCGLDRARPDDQPAGRAILANYRPHSDPGLALRRPNNVRLAGRRPKLQDQGRPRRQRLCT